MIHIKTFIFCLLFISAFCIKAPILYAADQTLSLSVTPPLFQLNITPGEIWKSAIKVINSNTYDLTVFAEVNNFQPSGEDGQGSIVPREEKVDEASSGTLADWISITHEPIHIPPEQSMEVPVTISVPPNAPPGGHFAAILIGTRPPESSGSSEVRTSQAVTSLFFLRVAGDIQEKGSVREFSVAHIFRESPEADFTLRFQNNGNVQLQPQGDITIYNMWGTKRGSIPINKNTHFGNVLPNSIRKYHFSWKGDFSLADVGRYTAEVALVYGQEGKQTAADQTSFWVIPLKATLIFVGSLAFFIGIIFWIVRRYVRRVLQRGGYDVSTRKEPRGISRTVRRVLRRGNIKIKEESSGVLDLRKRTKDTDE